MNGNIAWGLSWDGGKSRRTTVLILVITLITTLAMVSGAPADRSLTSVIVLERPGSGSGPQDLVERVGGTVTHTFGILNGFAARVPTVSLSALAAEPGVLAVTGDYPVTLSGMVETTPVYITSAESATASTTVASGWDSEPPPTGDGTLYEITQFATNASWYWRNGLTGQGVDVALIDSGIAPVYGLNSPGKVVNGPDLSFDSQAENLRYLDAYGHGTHMAGIIAGRDFFAPAHPTGDDGKYHFLGMAPDSRLVNVKVAASNGAVDVSQVIAAIDWVVQHRNENGLNIRVLNLSFGTDGSQDYRIDPLAFAVEAAWKNGIAVVAAAGNEGNNHELRNPAYDPYVIAVGSVDTQGTATTRDDIIPSFSNCGTADRHVDIVAPGRSIVSLRDYGSYLDEAHPGARVGFRFFRGSGTSQSAAVVAGAAALVFSEHPEATPDQVKQLLTASATSIKGISGECQGAGLLNLKRAYGSRLAGTNQIWPASTGTGSLEAARGDSHVAIDGVPLTGEQDIFGKQWNGLSWSGLSWSGLSWSGGWWNGSEWAGNDWSGLSWSGLSWSGLSWSGLSWSGLSWSGLSWSTNDWSDLGWTGLSWSGLSWSGLSWSGDVWLDR